MLRCAERQYIHRQPSFFFQAEDGIRDRDVTGVQTCALPIFTGGPGVIVNAPGAVACCVPTCTITSRSPVEIGRASCRERVWNTGVNGAVKKKREDRTQVQPDTYHQLRSQPHTICCDWTSRRC